MPLNESGAAAPNAIRAYRDGEVRIGERTVAGSCLVSASRIEPWGPRSVAALTVEDFAPVFAIGPEVVVLGTGERQEFPPAAVRREFAARGIGLESMDLGAACRTYNVLLQEERKVVAALVMGGPPEEDTGRESSFDQPIIRS